MIAALIRWSVANRFLVVLATLFLAAAGLWGVRTTPVDALPDLSDVQVIVKTTWSGQAPRVIEDPKEWNEIRMARQPQCAVCATRGDGHER